MPDLQIKEANPSPLALSLLIAHDLNQPFIAQSILSIKSDTEWAKSLAEHPNRRSLAEGESITLYSLGEAREIKFDGYDQPLEYYTAGTIPRRQMTIFHDNVNIPAVDYIDNLQMPCRVYLYWH